MSRFLIYNFSGYPGDLYQLIPYRYLASFLSSLNQAFPGSTELWDRGNLKTAKRLSPHKGISQELFRYLGRKIFQKLKEKRQPSHLLLIPFKLLIDQADRYAKVQSKRIIEEDAEKILKQNIEIVFLNFFQGPGLEQSLYLADILKKERNNIRIVAIGHRVSWLREYAVYISQNIDAYLMGTHSNMTLIRLAQGMDYEKIPNLIFKDSQGEPVYTGLNIEQDLDALALPDYHKETYQGAEGKIPLFEISLTNEACPFQCNFCIRPVNYGTKWVKRSIGNIVDELEHLISNYDAHYFRISDSTPPPGMLTELAKELIKRGLNEKIFYSSFSRCYDKQVEDFELLKKSGCEALFLGIESGAQKMLDEILNKKVRVSAIESTVKTIHQAGIFTVLSFIMPSPCETRETQEETYSLIQRLKPYIGSVLMQPAGVYPNTEWFNHPEKYGIFIPPDYFQRVAGYPIEPLKPLRFWPAFPFSYQLFEKSAQEVTFADIVACFNEFESRIRKELDIPNIQDYGYLIAKQQQKDPAEFSSLALEYMVTRNTKKLAELLDVKCKE